MLQCPLVCEHYRKLVPQRRALPPNIQMVWRRFSLYFHQPALRDRLTFFDQEISLTPEQQTFLRILVWCPLHMARKAGPSRPTTAEFNALTPMEHHRTNWQMMIAVNINSVGWGFERPYRHHGTTTKCCHEIESSQGILARDEPSAELLSVSIRVAGDKPIPDRTGNTRRCQTGMEPKAKNARRGWSLVGCLPGHDQQPF